VRASGYYLRKCLRDLEGKLIVVEGLKDRKALKSLGVKNIMHLGGRPLADFTLHVSKSLVHNDAECDEVVILTDFDSKGREIAARLGLLFKRHKIRVNSRVRNEFMRFGKSCIEDFKEGDVYGKAGSNINKIRGESHNKGKGRD